MSISSKINRRTIQTAVGLFIMLFFWLLPIDIPYITPMGMKVIGIFIGTIYMWSMGNMIWPSILAVVLLGWYGFMPMDVLLKEWMGNPTVVMIFFLLILIGVFSYHKCHVYVARFFMTRKIIEGRPWMFTFFILLGVYTMATFINGLAGVFLFLPIVHEICEDIGFGKRDTYTKLITISVVMAALLGFPTAYFNGTVLGLNANYEQISGHSMPGGPYLIVGVILGILCLIAIVLTMKLFIKPDVSKLQNITVDQLNKNPLPEMSPVQKVVSIGILVFVASMLFPVLIPNNPVSDFMSANLTGIAATIVAILGAISISGEKVFDFPKIIANNFSWQTYFLIASSLLLGSAITHESVGFTVLLEESLTPIFQDMNILVFTISIVLVGVGITNLFNSSVLVVILHPVIYTYSTITGINAVPIVMIMTFATLSTAAVTPSASPYAAAIYSQKEYVTPRDIYRYTLLFILVEVLIFLFVGVPLIGIVF